MTTRPTYAELCGREDAPPGSSWGVFGEDDQLGTLGIAGAEHAVAASACVVSGEVFGLDYPLEAFDPPIASTRSTLRHRIFSRHVDHRDDVVEMFFPQASSQWDGLRHRRHHRHGFYNRTPDEAVTEHSATLGVSRWADRGIVSRGLVLDVARGSGDIDHEGGEALGVEHLRVAVESQGVVPVEGDVLLLHTGWAHWYLGLSEKQRAEVRGRRRFTGLAQDREVLAWLWDSGFAAVATDTYAVEVLPPRADSVFGCETDEGMMHQELIAMLGMALGELWRLDALAAACARDRRYTCLLASKPLHLRGGVGSPANAMAIR
ncbi:cyclase family protein [Aeromicrobium sp. YIM 150415]|uniref:cyclase family protein n=1 Tax=Aeromicrobium sp. YIM 150415 TaxID=2803912 RepID=UPI001962E3E6|nr:cyclase family protein [Aeromicrobium sp. YIM 150415]MBM9463408.1 cyclase family protein [Aeromicrobium sp. YIM 150415]